MLEHVSGVAGVAGVLNVLEKPGQHALEATAQYKYSVQREFLGFNW